MQDPDPHKVRFSEAESRKDPQITLYGSASTTVTILRLKNIYEFDVPVSLINWVKNRELYRVVSYRRASTFFQPNAVV
jgi:hypothetical protein